MSNGSTMMPPGHRFFPYGSGANDPERKPTDPEQLEMDEVELSDAEKIAADKVLKHRFERFVAFGFTVHQSRAMALDKKVDTHKAMELVQNGCDPLLAFDILS